MKRVVLVAVLAISVAGCSHVFVDGPPEVIPPFPEKVECTTKRVFPTLDVLFGGLRFAGGVNSLSFIHPEDKPGVYGAVPRPWAGNDWLAVLAAVEGGFTIWSGVRGHKKVSAC